MVLIGNCKIEHPVALGPMAGITDLPFRILCREQGCGLLYTEMVSAKALHFKNENTQSLMETVPGEHPIALQLFGSDPEILAEQASACSEGPWDLIDLNMGCPVPKVVNNGEGSALMKDPELVYRIVSAMVKASSKPVTVKIRRGFTVQDENAAEIAKVVEAAGAAAVAVHGRTRSQYYTGQADLECIRRVKEAVSIPVIGNGDIASGQDAKHMMDYTGCDMVMVARAARGNPWIFSQINGFLSTGREPERPSWQEIRNVILRHLDMEVEYKGEYIAVQEMRKHIAWYVTGIRGASAIRRAVNAISTAEEVKNLLLEAQL